MPLIFKPGDAVTIRPSQQLFWRNLDNIVAFESAYYNFGETFRDISYKVITGKESNFIPFTQILITEPQGHFSSTWVDYTLDIFNEFDFTKHRPEFRKWLGKNPRCKWCHEPITKRKDGEFKGHWEHTLEPSSLFSPKNKWVCITGKTIDQKWHVAENPLEKPYLTVYSNLTFAEFVETHPYHRQEIKRAEIRYFEEELVTGRKFK